MNVTQSIQTNPAKALELFAQLGNSSDGSVKTRERLLNELKNEIAFYTQVEETHLLAALRKHKETKSLASDAAAGNCLVQKLLDELEQMPKDSPDFLGQVKELRQAFQQHVRQEKKELLPALKKVLNDEQMQGLAHDMETGRADADRQRQEEAEQRRAAAREEREEKQHQADETQRQAEQDERHRQETEERRTAAKEKRAQAHRQEEQARLQDRRERAVAASRKSAETPKEEVRQEADSVSEGLQRLQPPPPANRIEGAIAPLTTGLLPEYGQLWMNLGSTTVESTARARSAISRCGSPVQLAQTQLRCAMEIGQAWMEAGTRMVEIAVRSTMRR